jgi:hypothetical protein
VVISAHSEEEEEGEGEEERIHNVSDSESLHSDEINEETEKQVFPSKDVHEGLREDTKVVNESFSRRFQQLQNNNSKSNSEKRAQTTSFQQKSIEPSVHERDEEMEIFRQDSFEYNEHEISVVQGQTFDKHYQINNKEYHEF